MTANVRKAVPIVGASATALTAAATAVAASLCCVGPAVVAVLGTGGALAVARLEVYRIYILGGGLLMLALGFAIAYRRDGVCRKGTCSTRASRFVRWSLWSSAFAMLLAILLPYLVY